MIPWLGCLTPSLSEQPRASNSWSDRKPLVAALLDNQKLRSLPHSTLCKKLKRWCRSLALCCCEANFNPIFWCRSNKLLCTSKMLHQHFHIWKSHKFVVLQNLFEKNILTVVFATWTTPHSPLYVCKQFCETCPNLAQETSNYDSNDDKRGQTKMTSKDYQRINY